MQSDSQHAEVSSRLDSWFNSLDPNLHETLAQLLAREGLRWLRDNATIPAAKASIDRIQDIFNRLMRRAPSAYQIDRFDHITRSRILAAFFYSRMVGSSAPIYGRRW